ncbi:MAG: hypothetical protein ACK56I_26005, partial [bacterium]
IVVSHLDSDVIERRPALPHRTDRVDLIEPRPCPVDPVCSDSVGALVSGGGLRISATFYYDLYYL